MFANFFARPTENLKRWDDAMANHRILVAIAGNDAHANIGLSLNDSSGQQWLGLKLDPYERSFRVVRTHVLIPKGQALTRDVLMEAISRGHCYVSFDIFGDPAGFSFTAEDLAGNGFKAIMGGQIPSTGGTRLVVKSPINCRFVLFRDGSIIEQKSGINADFTVDRAGRYRVEAYLDSLPAPAKGQPWIISNPIYLVPVLTQSGQPEKAQKSVKQAS